MNKEYVSHPVKLYAVESWISYPLSTSKLIVDNLKSRMMKSLYEQMTTQGRLILKQTFTSINEIYLIHYYCYCEAIYVGRKAILTKQNIGGLLK